MISPATGEWRDDYDRVSKRDRHGLTPDLTTRWATGNDNFVCSSLWDFKSYFTCRKILRHGTFRLYFPSERKVCCGFLSPLKIHRLGRVLNPQPLGQVASTKTTTPPRRHQAVQKLLVRDTDWWLGKLFSLLGSRLENASFKIQPPAMFVSLDLRKSGLIKSCSPSENLSKYKTSLHYFDWWQFLIHLRSLDVSHFGVVEAMG
jgi:hypothetical protein